MEINDEMVRQVTSRREQEEAAAQAYEESYARAVHRVALGVLILVVFLILGALAGAFSAGYHKARVDALNEYAHLLTGEGAE